MKTKSMLFCERNSFALRQLLQPGWVNRTNGWVTFFIPAPDGSNLTSIIHASRKTRTCIGIENQSQTTVSMSTWIFVWRLTTFGRILFSRRAKAAKRICLLYLTFFAPLREFPLSCLFSGRRRFVCRGHPFAPPRCYLPASTDLINPFCSNSRTKRLSTKSSGLAPLAFGYWASNPCSRLATPAGYGGRLNPSLIMSS
jgi:hypothetical protein